MRPAAIYGTLGLLLVATGLLLPVVLPEYRWEYSVEQGIREGAPGSEDVEPVPYAELSQAEQTLFDTARNRTEPVRRASPVNGSHVISATDEGGYRNSFTAVSYRGANYTVVGWQQRPHFGLRNFGKAILVGLGAVICSLTAVGVVAGRLADRIG